MGEELVLVTSFDELRTGMRVAAMPCRQPLCRADRHTGVLGKEVTGEVTRATGASANCRYRLLVGSRCPGRGQSSTQTFAVSQVNVAERRVYRFVSDIGINDQLAAESNPYLERAVTGTNGREETRVLSKERGR